MSDLRPFYFMIVVWGQKFCDYLTNYCIPSLLAPNNIPKLINNKKNKFLICTTVADWQKLEIHPTFIKLKQYMELVLIEIPLPPKGVSGCQHMGVGHKLATDILYKDKVYGIALTPDLIVSDGTVAAIQKHALEGKHAVLCAAIRFAEEPFFAGLQELGINKFATTKTFSKSTQTELIATSRQLVQLCLQSFHSETETFDFESRNYGQTKAVALWRVPNQKGLLIHSLSWCPMLIDYGVMQSHDTTALEKWTMDGDYLYKNLHVLDKIYTCQDSDEMMLVSWSPLKFNEEIVKAEFKFSLFKKLRKIKNKLMLGLALRHRFVDPLKLALFLLPIRWHVDEIDESWKHYENAVESSLHNKLSGVSIDIYQIYTFILYYTKKIVEYTMITLFAFCGNKYARARLKVRIERQRSGNRVF